jgi:hypothetical protein
MTNNQTLCIDVLSLMPNGSICFIQAPTLENLKILQLMRPSPFAYFREITLNEISKRIIKEEVIINYIQEDFQSIEIRFNNKLLFEGYDGIEYGLISKSINLPTWFINRHIKTENCGISQKW